MAVPIFGEGIAHIEGPLRRPASALAELDNGRCRAIFRAKIFCRPAKYGYFDDNGTYSAPKEALK